MSLIWSLLIGVVIGFAATFFNRRADTIQLCAMVIAGVFGGMLGALLGGQLAVISPVTQPLVVVSAASFVVLIVAFSFSRKEHVN